MHTACINRTRQRASAFNIIHRNLKPSCPKLARQPGMSDIRVICMQIRIMPHFYAESFQCAQIFASPAKNHDCQQKVNLRTPHFRLRGFKHYSSSSKSFLFKYFFSYANLNKRLFRPLHFCYIKSDKKMRQKLYSYAKSFSFHIRLLQFILFYVQLLPILSFHDSLVVSRRRDLIIASRVVLRLSLLCKEEGRALSIQVVYVCDRCTIT